MDTSETAGDLGLSPEILESQKQKAFLIIRAAFARCEAEDINGMVALGAFLDHMIAHLVDLNGRDVTAGFMDKLAQNVRSGVYDIMPEKN